MAKKKITISVSFPQEDVLDLAKSRSEELGIRSFSEYVNQLIRYDLGLPNYISSYIQKGDRAAAEALIEKLSPGNKKRNS